MGEAELERTRESRAPQGKSRPIWSFIIPFRLSLLLNQDAGNLLGDQARLNQFWINCEPSENKSFLPRSQLRAAADCR
jgi:hypothetical protein